MPYPKSTVKTTVEISSGLLSAARRVAAERGTTLRRLIELGLQRVVDEHDARGEFRLRDASFGGRGLQPEFRDATWEAAREAAYRGRGE
jgi:hypothetical protein